MARVVFGYENQIDFFERIKAKSKLSRDVLGGLVGISGRQYGDWSRGRFLPRKDAVEFLSKRFGVAMPQIIELRGEWWSGSVNGRKAALAKYHKYGYFGRLTLEDRRKGGINSQVEIKKRPEYYRSIGVKVRNVFKKPKHSKLLAEFVGIVLGDGSLTKDQLRITLNSVEDKQYIDYVVWLTRKLFGYKASKLERKNALAVDILISGVGFVEFLVSLGLKVGNKVGQQVDVPNWIKNNIAFSKRCLRGLMDTDGGVFDHFYIVNKKKYCYQKVCFTNKSIPLLEFVYGVLSTVKMKPKHAANKRVWLYSANDVQLYFRAIGSSNYRLNRKLRV